MATANEPPFLLASHDIWSRTDSKAWLISQRFLYEREIRTGGKDEALCAAKLQRIVVYHILLRGADRRAVAEGAIPFEDRFEIWESEGRISESKIVNVDALNCELVLRERVTRGTGLRSSWWLTTIVITYRRIAAGQRRVFARRAGVVNLSGDRQP